MSEGEMELLNLLWELGPSSLAVVHKNYSRPIGYTTIQTRLNRMVDKRVLSRSTDCAIGSDGLRGERLGVDRWRGRART